MNERQKLQRLQDFMAYQDERRGRREAAQAAGGSEYGVQAQVITDNLEEAWKVARKFRDLQSEDGVLGALKRRLVLPRLEWKLAYMVHQTLTGNSALAEIDMESGLFEPYSPSNKYDRPHLAQRAAHIILNEPENVKAPTAW